MIESIIIFIVFYILTNFILYSKLFKKEGYPIIFSIIPFINSYILCKISGRPIWFTISYILLDLIACIYVIFFDIDITSKISYGLLLALFGFFVIIVDHLGDNYNKGVPFKLGMIFLPIIFFPILGFQINTDTQDQIVDQND